MKSSSSPSLSANFVTKTVSPKTHSSPSGRRTRATRHLTPQEFSEITKVPLQTVYNWLQRGRLSAQRWEGRYYIEENLAKPMLAKVQRTKHWLTPREVAQTLQMPLATLYHHLQRGAIRHQRLGHRYRIRRDWAYVQF